MSCGHDESLYSERLAEHIKTYDALASEYESRVATVTCQTEHAIEWFLSYLKPGDKIF